MRDLKLTITSVTTDAQRDEVFRLRYQVYVTEMCKPYRHADREAQSLRDELDETAVILAAMDGAGSVVGTVRVNRAEDLLHITALATHLGLDRVPNVFLPRVTLCSRLVVSASVRGRGAVVPLVRAIYRWGLDNGVEINVMHTALELVPLFARLGFRRFGRTFIDEEAGREQQPLYLAIRDFIGLQCAGSPFLNDLAAVTSCEAVRRTFTDPLRQNHGGPIYGRPEAVTA
jgi:predicted GNAT family N-acyltransferase